MLTMNHLSIEELEAGIENIRQSPRDNGVLELIVRRPQIDERESLTEGALNVTEGLVGDNWKARGSKSMPDGSADPEMQINIML